MDSSFLNIIYDDPFDGNYVKYDNDTEFWSTGSEVMGMQLTETLHGILPIAPTDAFHIEDDISTINIQNNINAFDYEDFAGQNFATDGTAIEIVTVDSNADGYDTDSEVEDSDNGNGDDDDEEADCDLSDFERQSQCSNGTFRTRTDSSSIGDYESHTSDYDDGDNVNKDEFNNSLTKNMDNASSNINNSLLDMSTILMDVIDDSLLNTSFLKNRTLSTNTINSDVDGLGLQIDLNNFDLAEFITKDDYQIYSSEVSANTGTNPVPNNNLQKDSSVVEVVSSKRDDSDCDSDIIIDVETVEIDDSETNFLKKTSETLKPSCTEEQEQHEEDIDFVDNVKKDPSWSPTQTAKKFDNIKVEEKTAAKKPKNVPLVPNKKQCDLLKGKFGKGKAKTMQKPINSKSKSIQLENSSAKCISSTATKKPIKNVGKIGIGIGNKDLSLCKHERNSISKQNFEDNNITIKSENVHKSPQQQQLISVKTTDEKIVQTAQVVKRKLNLEEYKKRRGDEQVATPTEKATSKLKSYKIPKLENKCSVSSNTDKDIKPIKTSTPTTHSEAVISIVKSLKEQKNLAPKTDPITEARNKVLRMQELKKAQQMRIIDSTISAKIPRVTKLLPLREIVKHTPYLNEGEEKSVDSSLKYDYEEIIIVSTGCNTDISLPPLLNQTIQPLNHASRSLLKSTALLSTISNTFQKAKANDNAKISTSSLIASIQDVVVKKTLPVREIEVSDVKDTSKPQYHGENKIIMHLRKDRIRNRMCTIGIQTNIQPEFPPLSFCKWSSQHKFHERTHRNRKRHYRKHNTQSSSSSFEYSSDDQLDNSNSSTISRSRENSCSSSLDRMRIYDSAIGTGGYSSRSTRKHRSSISSSYSESANHIAHSRRQRRTSYTKRSTRKRSRSPYSTSSYSTDSGRSISPYYRRSRSRSNSRTRSGPKRSSSYRQGSKNYNYMDRNVSQPAVEERRIVYVGRIEQETTREILKKKFLQYGTIKQISIHYKDTGMKYGFVTFERSQDAFAAIDNSTHDPQINMYDVSFGGRRAFCRASYADLDNAGINTYESYVFPQLAKEPKEEESFEALLMKMKKKLTSNKTNSSKASNNVATCNTAASTMADKAANTGNKI